MPLPDSKTCYVAVAQHAAGRSGETHASALARFAPFPLRQFFRRNQETKGCYFYHRGQCSCLGSIPHDCNTDSYHIDTLTGGKLQYISCCKFFFLECLQKESIFLLGITPGPDDGGPGNRIANDSDSGSTN
jgi:hypothetical protein